MEFTITVEVGAPWTDDDGARLGELLTVLRGRPELRPPVEATIIRASVVALTMTVQADTERAARERASRAIVTEMVALGLV